VQFVRLSGTRRPIIPWLLSSILEKGFRMLPIKLLSPYKLSISIGKRSMLMLLSINKLRIDFDWIIAHNPASFYPAFFFMRKNGCRLGVDVEDYHPGETNNKYLKFRLKMLMRMVLPHASYISYASPLIMKAVNNDVELSKINQLSVLNSFSSQEFNFTSLCYDGPLKLVWFSQFIDKGRGLEVLLQVIDQMSDIELHLVGNLNNHFFEEYIEGKINVRLHEALPQATLHGKLNYFDVGLALEPGRDLNNQLAISNKILAYAQAGLFILASKTPGQDYFLQQSNLEYLQTELNESTLYDSLHFLIKSKADIRRGRNNRCKKGHVYSWECTSNQILKAWFA
jgi:hypothetical protein